jgi:hypothetical protein
VLVACLLAALPACLARDLHALRHMCYVGFVSALVLTAAIAYRCGRPQQQEFTVSFCVPTVVCLFVCCRMRLREAEAQAESCECWERMPPSEMAQFDLSSTHRLTIRYSCMPMCMLYMFVCV